jgi:hypothetical protein
MGGTTMTNQAVFGGPGPSDKSLAQKACGEIVGQAVAHIIINTVKPAHWTIMVIIVARLMGVEL